MKIVLCSSSVSSMINDWIVSESSPNHRSINAVWRRWDVSGDNRVHRPLSGAAHLLRFQAMSRGVSRFEPDTLAHVPNLSNDLEKRVFLVAIKDTITVPNHSPWGCPESSQWLWQLSITQRGVSVTPEGMSPVRHGLRFGVMHHNAGFILMLLNSDLCLYLLDQAETWCWMASI